MTLRLQQTMAALLCTMALERSMTQCPAQTRYQMDRCCILQQRQMQARMACGERRTMKDWKVG